jgi:hypothetical protein
MTEHQLYTLYVWLWKQFPEEQQIRTSMVYQQTPQMLLWDFRSDIPNLLARRNTESSCVALEMIVRDFPQLIGIRRMLETSRENLRIKTWIPYEPKYILQLSKNNKARLVANEAELLELVIDCLQELQSELQGHNARSREVWNEVPNNWIYKLAGIMTSADDKNVKFYRPKNEEALSDFVANSLRSKLENKHGVVLNREVDIRRNPGSKGERVDILVDATSLPSDEAVFKRISVVIEVKCTWNRELKTAMKMQLADQYLDRSVCRSGIFLVGYFNSPQWDATDQNQIRSKQFSLDLLRSELETQANELSVGGLNLRSFVLDCSLK